MAVGWWFGRFVGDCCPSDWEESRMRISWVGLGCWINCTTRVIKNQNLFLSFQLFQMSLEICISKNSVYIYWSIEFNFYKKQSRLCSVLIHDWMFEECNYKVNQGKIILYLFHYFTKNCSQFWTMPLSNHSTNCGIWVTRQHTCIDL